jgi:hypothetical protein
LDLQPVDDELGVAVAESGGSPDCRMAEQPATVAPYEVHDLAFKRHCTGGGKLFGAA